MHKWRVWTRKNIWCRCVINLTKPTKNDNWMFKNIPGDWTRHLRVRDALVSHDFMNGTTLKPPLLVKVFSWLHTISWLYACSLSLLSGTHLTLVVGRHNGKVHCTRTYSNPTNLTTYQSTFGIFDIPSLVWHTFISVTSNYIFVSPLFVSTSACDLCTAKPVSLGGWNFTCSLNSLVRRF